MEELAPIEIHALSRIMDELNYYQLLHLEPDASQGDVKRAYFATSRTFHPDANQHLPADLRDQCEGIAKRVTEAYCVLRDPRKRKVYDEMLQSGPEDVRMQLADAKAAHARQDADARQGKTPQGRQFFQRAVEDMRRADWPAAIRNIQMALTFEPGNVQFQQQLEAAKQSKDKPDA